MLFRSLNRLTMTRGFASSSTAAQAPKILLTRMLPSEGDAALQKAAAAGHIDITAWKEDSQAPRDWIIESLSQGGYAGILCMLVDKIDKAVLDAAGPSLRTISTLSAGYDHLDIGTVKERQISVGTTPDALTDATADVGAMLALMASRRAKEGVLAVQEGNWPNMPWSPLLLCGHGLANSTVGVLGFGKIGQMTLRRLLGFGVKRALYLTSKPGQELDPAKDYYGVVRDNKERIEIRAAKSLDELATECDFVVVTCTLNPSTFHAINADFFSKMKPTSYLVNTSRGGVVDTAALVEALKAGKIAGAGLDVLENEPVGADHPLVSEPRACILPHIGSATIETRQLMATQSVQNLLAGLEVPGYDFVSKV